MKQLRFAIVLVVVLNIVIIGWLLLRNPTEGTGGSVETIMRPLVADNAMESARYDLSDRADELNIILISMDALRYDRTGLGDNKASLTPNLDRFAEEAVVFHDAVSPAPWTLPAHMSVWTARWPSVHRVTNKLRPLSGGQMVDTSLSPGIETYPDLLIRGGWVAAGFTGGAGVQGRYGFGRGFQTYLDDRYFGGLDYAIPPALRWLSEHRNERFFLFVHGYDVHGQYALPEGEIRSISGYEGRLKGDVKEQARLREQGLSAIDKPGARADLTGILDKDDGIFLEQVYDLKVRDADERLGVFMVKLKAMGLYDNSVIALISDHGDEFMEHGGLDHGATLYQEQLHVVMAVRFPGYGRRQDVAAPVRLIDLFPTLFESMGLNGPAGVDGQSLLPLLRGETVSTPVYAETDYRLYVHQRMIREGRYKLILDLLDGERELYDLTADAEERTNIASSEPRRTYEMEQRLRTWMEASSTNPADYLGLDETPISIF